MTRHDQLVPTAAPRCRSPGPAAHSVTAIALMPANPTKSAVGRTANRPVRRPLDAPGTLGASAHGTRPTAPKQQTP